MVLGYPVEGVLVPDDDEVSGLEVVGAGGRHARARSFLSISGLTSLLVYFLMLRRIRITSIASIFTLTLDWGFEAACVAKTKEELRDSVMKFRQIYGVHTTMTCNVIP